MHTLSKNELKTLTAQHKGPCVSMFMPTFRAGAESQQNQIRLKNLLRDAEEKLLAAGRRAQELKTLLEPAQTLSGNALFWRRQSDGLALFLCADLFRCFCLPEAFEERIVVADRFHIGPLMPVLRNDRRFYILTLSQKEVRLLQGTGQGVSDIELEALPKSLDEALQYDAAERHLRFHSGGGGTTMISGHGGTAEDTKDNLLKFFRLIDRALHDHLKDEQAPLVLAGVDYLFPIYREVNTFPHLIDEGIPGNPRGINPESLHQSALTILDPHFQKAETEAIAQYRQSSGTGLTSVDIREIVTEAAHGRVGMLFIAAGSQHWGTYERESGAIETHPAPEPEDDDLIEIAAIQTYLNGGSVFTLSPKKMPEPKDLAALFRY